MPPSPSRLPLLLGLALLTTAHVWGQASVQGYQPTLVNLATDDTGSRLFIETTLTLRSETAYGNNSSSKILRYTGGELSTVLRETDTAPGSTALAKSSYSCRASDGSGRLIAAIKTEIRSSPIGGIFTVSSGVVKNLETGEVHSYGAGQAFLSRNGEWLVTLSTGETPEKTILRRYHLTGDAMDSIEGPNPLDSSTGERRLADDGSFYALFGKVLQVWKPAASAFSPITPLPPPFIVNRFAPVTQFTIDPAGQWAVAGGDLFDSQLWRINLQTGATVLVSEEEMPMGGLRLTNDGSQLLFLHPLSGTTLAGGALQAWVRDFATGSVTQITNETEGVQSAAISGDGQIVYLSTGDHKLIRLTRTTGNREELTPAYPDVRATDPSSNVFAPGGHYWFWGRGFHAAEFYWKDHRIDPLFHSDDDFEFLLPDSTPDADTGPNLGIGATDSPFLPFLYTAEAHALAPAFVGLDGPRGYPLLHSDGSGITTDSPAHGSEQITARMTGVLAAGAVSPALRCSLIEEYMKPLSPIVIDTTTIDLAVTSSAPDPVNPGYARVGLLLPGVDHGFNPSRRLSISCAAGGLNARTRLWGSY